MTKIKISDAESYLIEIPDEIDRSKLDFIINRLLFVQKMMGKDVLSSVIEGKQSSNNLVIAQSDKLNKPQNRPFLNNLRADRNLTVRLYTAFYKGKEALAAFAKEINQENYLANALPSKNPLGKIKLEHQITAEECGLKSFPKPGQMVSRL